jgi:hypothetical protein
MWSIIAIIFNLGRSRTCRSKMIDAARHYILDTLEVLIELGIDFDYFN